MEQIPDIEDFHRNENRILIPKLNDIDVDDMRMATPRINVSKEEYKVLLHDENLMKKMNSLFDNLEVVDGNVVVKEKKSWANFILQHNTVWYSSMLMLSTVLYALYFGRMFISGIYFGLWFTSICNHHVQDQKHVINMLDRVMCQVCIWGCISITYYYQMPYYHYFIYGMICICYFFSLIYNSLYPKKYLWVAPHLLMHLLCISGGFVITDECYAIRCSPIDDFMRLNN